MECSRALIGATTSFVGGPRLVSCDRLRQTCRCWPGGGLCSSPSESIECDAARQQEWAQRVRDSFVPLMRELAGFRGYYLLDGGPNELIAISMFDSADEALVSNAKAADWVRNNVLDFTRGLPEVMVGNVLIAEVKPESSSKSPASTYDIDDRDVRSAARQAGHICPIRVGPAAPSLRGRSAPPPAAVAD